MRNKAEIFRDLGFTEEYNPHAGIPADTKQLILAELLIDIRDQIHELNTIIFQLLDPNL